MISTLLPPGYRVVSFIIGRDFKVGSMTVRKWRTWGVGYTTRRSAARLWHGRAEAERALHPSGCETIEEEVLR